MGSSLTCDRCGVTLEQGEPDASPLVWERREPARRADEDDVVQHLCVGCFREGEEEEGYVRRTVYACVGEENARQLTKQEANAKTVPLSPMTKCQACGAMYRSDMPACFFCGASPPS